MFILKFFKIVIELCLIGDGEFVRGGNILYYYRIMFFG